MLTSQYSFTHLTFHARCAYVYFISLFCLYFQGSVCRLYNILSRWDYLFQYIKNLFSICIIVYIVWCVGIIKFGIIILITVHKAAAELLQMWYLRTRHHCEQRIWDFPMHCFRWYKSLLLIGSYKLIVPFFSHFLYPSLILSLILSLPLPCLLA